MTWVTALIPMTLALPALLARLAGGIPRILARNWRPLSRWRLFPRSPP